jgi:hypothetical protein
MSKDRDFLGEGETVRARELRLEAVHLQAIEDNPLDADDIAMFEMFEREHWPHDRRIAHIIERAKARSSIAAE